jgi:hypothetical protein
MPAATRRRRRTGGGIADVLKLVSDLGAGSVLGFWDFRQGVSGAGVADSWADQLGVVGPLLAAGAQRPVINGNGTLSFDGVANFMRTVQGLGPLTSSAWCVLVSRGTNTIARREFEISIGTATTIFSGAFPTALIWRITAAASADVASSAAITAAPRVLHTRKTSAVDVAARVGTGAEVAAALATGDLTATRFTVGAARNDTLFSNMQELRAVILGLGVYTPAQAALVNAWAQANHGAIAGN